MNKIKDRKNRNIIPSRSRKPGVLFCFGNSEDVEASHNNTLLF